MLILYITFQVHFSGSKFYRFSIQLQYAFRNKNEHQMSVLTEKERGDTVSCGDGVDEPFVHPQSPFFGRLIM